LLARLNSTVATTLVLTCRRTLAVINIVTVTEVTLLTRLDVTITAALVLTGRGTVIVVAVASAIVTLLTVTGSEDTITAVTCITDAVSVGVSLIILVSAVGDVRTVIETARCYTADAVLIWIKLRLVRSRVLILRITATLCLFCVGEAIIVIIVRSGVTFTIVISISSVVIWIRRIINHSAVITSITISVATDRRVEVVSVRIVVNTVTIDIRVTEVTNVVGIEVSLVILSYTISDELAIVSAISDTVIVIIIILCRVITTTVNVVISVIPVDLMVKIERVITLVSSVQHSIFVKVRVRIVTNKITICIDCLCIIIWERVRSIINSVTVTIIILCVTCAVLI
jgi:hypothetical protein